MFKKIAISINKKYLVIFACIILIVIFLYPKNKIIIWAWERNENLTFLNNNIDVAYYAGSVILDNGAMAISGRVQPLKLGSETKVIPVIRIDNFDTVKELTVPRMKKIEDFIIQTCDQKLVVGCQIDFDAKSSERELYKTLISSVRERLPKNIPLSMTALVSWCDTYSWLNDTKIDFAVPMFYRLGSDEQMIQGGYTGKTFMGSPKCSSSIGVTTDETIPKAKYIKSRDIYIFNPHSWTEEELKRILKII